MVGILGRKWLPFLPNPTTTPSPEVERWGPEAAGSARWEQFPRSENEHRISFPLWSRQEFGSQQLTALRRSEQKKVLGKPQPLEMSERLEPTLVFLRISAGLPGHLNRQAEQAGWDLTISVAKEIIGK